MGSSCEANGQSIDSTVGGLVWVRRRNGSWWPGRILGPDELPESCLVSPRSGTPVKLLGREDASVDWYNLEKSKRVKAFRCGEYDECIEKAKITASISCKKAVKYARREDAILHALELESSRLPKDNPDKQPHEDAENISDKLSGLESSSVSPQELPHTAASADNSLEGSRRRTPNDSEDDGTEGSKKRMRGLEDLGIGGAVSSFKRKRTRVAHVHDFLKKKNRRRQLTKVLKSTAMVTVPVMCEQPTGRNGLFLSDVPDTSGLPNALGFPDNEVAGMEYNGLKGSRSDSTGDVTNNANNYKQKENENSSISELLENGDSSGRLFDVPFIGEEKQTAGSSLGLVPEKALPGVGPQSGQSSLVETVLLGPDELQESGSISSDAAGVGANINHIINNSTSKWQHKGKRNLRNKRKSRVTVNPKYQQPDFAYQKNDMGSLYDVNIEVKAGHFPQHLPYISLLSKFTGQPVTGHSLEVEVLNDAISDLSLNSSECLSSSCELGVVNGDAGMVPEASKKPRKNGLLCSKKIRRLSSLTISKRPCETGMLKRPDLACIPLKVVFGRINAALGISSTDTGRTR